MPLTNSYNITATSNEQPEYQMLWEPMAVIASSSSTAWVPGSALMYTNAGIGATPGPGGDGAYTVQTVDLAATTTTTYFAGVLLGVGALGSSLQSTSLTTSIAPNTIAGNASQVAMVGKRGICQVLCDSTTTVGHGLKVSTSNAGIFSDTGATTQTYGSIFGVILQAVTISSGTALVWVKFNAF